MTQATSYAAFWEQVDRRGPDDCWEWQGTRNKQGYGRFGKVGIAHRVAYELTHGIELPGGRALYVCHHCDNPPCVNPAHLFLGTPTDNARDMIRKGRAPRRPRGELSPVAKLTDAQVAEINARLLLVERVDICIDCGDPAYRRSWCSPCYARRRRHHNLPPWVSINSIAREFGVSPSLIHAIRRGAVWCHIEHQGRTT